MATQTKTDRLADILERLLISPNVSDSNGEPANLVDAVDDLSRAVWYGLEWRTDPARRPNAIEGHGEALKQAGESIASAIRDLADAIREMKQ
jgi:hypothetical protein